MLDFENLKVKEFKLFEFLSLQCDVFFVSPFVFRWAVSLSSLNFFLRFQGPWEECSGAESNDKDSFYPSDMPGEDTTPSRFHLLMGIFK